MGGTRTIINLVNQYRELSGIALLLWGKDVLKKIYKLSTDTQRENIKTLLNV
jgi:hypothetical protein